jgi:uncharacterized protein (DUF2267 family)
MNLILHFDKFLAEHNEFINSLSTDLVHPEDQNRVARTLRAVLHALRDRLTVPQSFHIIAQLPAFIKLYYIEDWKYPEKPVKYDSVEAFSKAVEKYQHRFGERDFSWNMSTEEIIRIVINALRQYLDDGIMSNISAELPPPLQVLLDRDSTILK